MKKTILFFEWSDLDRQPVNFNSSNEFVDFCQTNRIRLSGNNKYHLLKDDATVYAVCRKGYPELVLSYNKNQLRKNFNKHNNKCCC